jgi:hypothetical protein
MGRADYEGLAEVELEGAALGSPGLRGGGDTRQAWARLERRRRCCGREEESAIAAVGQIAGGWLK